MVMVTVTVFSCALPAEELNQEYIPSIGAELVTIEIVTEGTNTHSVFIIQSDNFTRLDGVDNKVYQVECRLDELEIWVDTTLDVDVYVTTDSGGTYLTSGTGRLVVNFWEYE